MVRKELSRRGFAKNIGLGAVAEVGASSCRATGMAGHGSRAGQLKTSIHHFRMRQADILAAAVLVFCSCVLGLPVAIAADEPRPDPLARIRPVLNGYCVRCHGGEEVEGNINLKALASAPSLFDHYENWKKVLAMLEAEAMPPEDEAQPGDELRAHLIAGIRKELAREARARAGDPGHVVLRRLTNVEYRHTIRGLTGLNWQPDGDIVDDAVGGEGFTNVGTVQFVQAPTLKRYLALAHEIASHAVVGAGPLRFSRFSQQKDGWEMSAITRIQEINRTHGFSPGSGEGGEPYGTQRYIDAFYTAWRYLHRGELGLGEQTLAELAAADGLDLRFVDHIWTVMNDPAPSFPTVEVARKWQALPGPNDDPDCSAPDDARAACREINQLLRAWQRDFAPPTTDPEEIPVMGAQAPEIRVNGSLATRMRRLPGVTRGVLQLSIVPMNPHPSSTISEPGANSEDAVVTWHQPRVRFPRGRPNPRSRPSDSGVLLSTVLSTDSLKTLAFGRHPSGVALDSGDFATQGQLSLSLEIQIPDGARAVIFSTQLAVDPSQEHIVKCSVSWKTPRGRSLLDTTFLGDPKSARAIAWKVGVEEFQQRLPQASNREPVPSDRDPIPLPFDGTYGNQDRYFFHYRLKYHRNDRFLVQHILDDVQRRQLDLAWIDLYAAQGYHDILLSFLTRRFELDVGQRKAANLDQSWIGQTPVEARPYLRQLSDEYQSVQQALQAAEEGHLEDLLQFAYFAWRRPLKATEQSQLLNYYDRLRTEYEFDHPQAVRTVLARVLVAPDFLYRLERPATNKGLSALSDWELASRLSYFLWSSMPDAALREAAVNGQLMQPEGLPEQTRRMLRDPKSRGGIATEFFGQWLGFYDFERHDGTDLDRFPEFNDQLKRSMFEEAVCFFEHIIREDRPVNEILFADYLFVNSDLARHYGIPDVDSSAASPQRIDGAQRYHRGGVLGLGAVLTKTSAPLRTSPVKRGDWILRRLLGTHVPPPPPDAGTIPADDVLPDGLTVRQRLEAHRRDPKCVNCHSRIDPLGFPLEHFDPIGRWRDRYRDGTLIDDTATTEDGRTISGFLGLRRFLEDHQEEVLRSFCRKLLGYALGRSVLPSDQELIDDMVVGLRNGNGRFSTAVLKIVSSTQFLYRRGKNDTASKRAAGPFDERKK